MPLYPMISIPVAVHNDVFRWQLDLFWYNHRMTYGEEAPDRVKAIIIDRNYPHEPRPEKLLWDTDIPHALCTGVFDDPRFTSLTPQRLAVPLNIQIGLSQILHLFDDDQVLEVNDCDMFHFRRHPPMNIGDNELYVCDLYEEWHLKSLSEHRHVIEPYFENGGSYYNGGFVPIIGKAGTFKKIMHEWIAVHADILNRDVSELMKWWAGMYALQAACEKASVQMIAKNYCYIPGANPLSDEQYIAHYSIDEKFPKREFPNINIGGFEKNIYYARILQWMAGYLLADYPST